MSSPQTTPQADTTATDTDAVVAALRGHDRFLVTSHENPDGDALGSLLAMHLALVQLGKDSRMYLAGQAPLPAEYGFLALGELRRELPPDAGERVLVAVDCANESRIGPDPEVLHEAPFTIDIDHHHDNTRFGDVNLVVASASSTGELLADVFATLGVTITPEIAEPLYTALVTDTGRFQYANTTPKALRLAADLVEAGADVHKVFQGVYESVQFAKLKLLARALERAQVYEGGRLVISHLLRTDFDEVGAVEPYSEGIIDYLRAVEGADMAALIREPPRGGSPARRVSLRSSVDELDVSAIARDSGSGGGHRQAAGFSSDDPISEITEFIVERFRLASQAGDEARRAGTAPAAGSPG
jgi:bifunctional oligoribonuclease and PAP phosphatase NrnA